MEWGTGAYVLTGLPGMAQPKPCTQGIVQTFGGSEGPAEDTTELLVLADLGAFRAAGVLGKPHRQTYRCSCYFELMLATCSIVLWQFKALCKH